MLPLWGCYAKCCYGRSCTSFHMNLCFFILLGIYLGMEPLDHFVTPWTAAHQAPLSLGFPGKNTGMGCHFLLQRIFSTQGPNSSLLHQQVDSLPLSHHGSPKQHHHNGDSTLNVLRNHQPVFQGSSTILHFHQQCLRILKSLHILANLSSPTLLHIHLNGCEVVSLWL